MFNSRCNDIDVNKTIDWELRTSYAINVNQSIVNEPLIDLPHLIDKIILPVLHIKLGVFTQFIKSIFPRKVRFDGETIEDEGNKLAIDFLEGKFKNKTYSKLSSGSFNGSEINQLIKMKNEFLDVLSPLEQQCFISFIELKENFFSNRPKDKEIVRKLF